MNILIFNWRDITHPWAGGAERHLHELAKSWVKQGRKVTLISGGYRGAAHREIIDGIRIIRVGNTYTVYLLAPIYYLLRLRWRRFDLVIDTAHGLPFFTPLFTRRRKILIIHHDHSRLWRTEWPKLIGKIGSMVESRFVPRLYRNTRVITLSDSTRSELKKMGYRDVRAVPPGIDNRFFNGIKIAKSDYPTILYLGRLRRYKRVETLISALPEIKATVTGAKLIIAGTGQDKARLEHLIREKNLTGDIDFVGYVSEAEKKRLLSSSWVLAFPSLIEGWGLVAMEAAISGTPTVGFRVPGVEDAIADKTSGFLVTSRSQFIKAINKILTDSSLREKMGHSARIWAKDYTWENSASKFWKEIHQG